MNLISTLQVRMAYKWWVTVAVTLGMLMSMMDSTIVNIAIPQMQRAFGASIHDVQWVVTIYMLTQASVIPAASYLTARFGGKRAYIWTLSAFLLGSVLCGLAWNLPSLILFRLFQGIGGGILLPMVMILQYQTFSPEERGTATSIMGLSVMVAPALGPVLGGYLVNSFGWQWAFFINVPLGIIAITIAQKVLRQNSSQARTRFDIVGFLTAAAGSALILYAITTIGGDTHSLWNILLLFGGLASLLIFVVTERSRTSHRQEPLLDLERFKDRTFTFSVLTQVIVFFVWFGTLFLIPIYLQTLHGETPLQAGAIQGTLALATLLILPVGGRLADRIGPRPVVLVGLTILSCAFASMMMLALHTPIWMVVIILMLLGSANGLTNQIPVSAMSRIQKEEAQEVANASTLMSVLRATAAPMGVATIASIVQFRSQQYMESLSSQGIKGTLLQQQSTLSAMHEVFLISSVLAMVALVVMFLVPGRKRRCV